MRATVLRFGLLAAMAIASAAHAAPSNEVWLGKSIFQSRCSLCHDDSMHMLNDVGPALFGVVNRQVGSVPGYRYSPALKAAGTRGDRWTPARLNRLLVEPTHVYSGTSMPAAISDPAERRELLAYLKSLHARE